MAVHGFCTLSTSFTSHHHHPSILQGPSSFSSSRPNLRFGLARGSSSEEEGKMEKTKTKTKTNVGDNVVLNLAWYTAEALGNVVSFFVPAKESQKKGAEDEDVLEKLEEGPIPREYAIQAVRKDYNRSYFLTGDVSPGIYEEDCEFADPVGSFRSLKRFTNNCRNFGAFLEKSDLKLMKLEELQDKFIVYWRFSCILKFPWRPILSSTGYTEYYWNPDSGKICRHKENWDVPKMVLLGQLLKPNPSMSWK